MKKIVVILVLSLINIVSFGQYFHESYTTTINGETYHTYISGYGTHSSIHTYKVTTPTFYSENVASAVRNYSEETKSSFDDFMNHQHKQATILKSTGIAAICVGAIGCICSIATDDMSIPLMLGSCCVIGAGSGLFVVGKHKTHDYNNAYKIINKKLN